MRFEGTSSYIATDDLKLAVNAAMRLQRPLLIKGEPGTGKTMLAEEVASGLGMPLLQWHIKSTTKAQQGLYEYDAVSRLRDSQLGDEKVKDIHNYIVQGVLWQSFIADQPVVLLIDEIDKADIEFPNDYSARSIAWSFSFTKPGKPSRRAIALWLSSPRTTKKSSPTHFCAAAFSITSSFPIETRCSASSMCTFPTLRRT